MSWRGQAPPLHITHQLNCDSPLSAHEPDKHFCDEQEEDVQAEQYEQGKVNLCGNA